MTCPALIPLSIALLCAALAQTATATACPPGYRGSYPKCVPAVRPAPGAPIEHRASDANTHAIIFVGGRNAINSQPVPPGHSPDTPAISSQPVPPGRSLRRIPNPGSPIERTAGH